MGEKETTVFLIGAGAVAGVWDPVIAALRRVRFPDLMTGEAANFAMARLVYRARLVHLNLDKQLGTHAEECTAELDGMRRGIAEELSAAEQRGELSLRAEFHDVVQHFVLDESRIGFITTNWDGMVSRAFRVPVLHVHGRIADSAGLYLPTEVAEEPYRD